MSYGHEVKPGICGAGITAFGVASKPDIYKAEMYAIEDEEGLSKVLHEMDQDSGICAIRDYETKEILFLCSYEIWDKIRIGDIKVEIAKEIVEATTVFAVPSGEVTIMPTVTYGGDLPEGTIVFEQCPHCGSFVAKATE